MKKYTHPLRDTSQNAPGLLEATARYRARMEARRLVPLRVDHRTVIYVSPDRATPQYARRWMERHRRSAAEHW